MFVGGFILGGLIIGALGCVYAPQVNNNIYLFLALLKCNMSYIPLQTSDWIDNIHLLVGGMLNHISVLLSTFLYAWLNAILPLTVL